VDEQDLTVIVLITCKCVQIHLIENIAEPLLIKTGLEKLNPSETNLCDYIR
jgi:hypothetical protein